MAHVKHAAVVFALSAALACAGCGSSHPARGQPETAPQGPRGPASPATAATVQSPAQNTQPMPRPPPITAPAPASTASGAPRPGATTGA